MWKKLRSLKAPKDDVQSNPSAAPSAPARYPSKDLPVSPTRKRSSVSSASQNAGRRPSQLSPPSTLRGPSPEPDQNLAGPPGLHVIYQPPAAALLDIIFVHGLGGASRKTWSKLQDPSLFWPGQWLPLEADICDARILSFGYNASFRAGGPKNISNVADFAKGLLFDMKFGKDGHAEDLEIGRVPIVFVVHSMGGLVVKKAYLLGQNDENYQDIIKVISAIIFLATPHRGTNLAELLNRILSVSFQSPKSFIFDLNKSSLALEELNEQFRHIAPKLSIVSFYETLQTTVGPKKLMVLEKDSSILGYPGEISKPLNADHHDVCKYTSADDPNYVSVRNALQSLVGRFRSKGADIPTHPHSEDSREVEGLFACSYDVEDDFDYFQQRRMPGTCEWILSELAFNSWSEETTGSCIAWLTAPPASGKSILSTYVIDHLRQSGHDCQYFFYRFGDQTKRSLNTLLRSIGFQVARSNPIFSRKLTELAREGISLEKTDPRIIWQKVFVLGLFKLVLSKPLHWVIDALDESDSPKVLLDLLQGISMSRTPIRVMIISRRTESLSFAFDRLSISAPVAVIQKEDREHNTSDIRTYVQKEMNYLRWSDELKLQIMESILHRAGGNFLWVHLVLEEIFGCHTEPAIRETLEDIPAGMGALYQRMELAVARNPRQSDRILAKTLLNWTICAHRPLTLKELSQALLPEFPEFLDLKRTISDVCGQFIVVDRTLHVTMVHQTARDYLTKTPDLQFSINLKDAHRELFVKTISFLLNPMLRSKLGQGQRAVEIGEPFLLYAITSWTYHLRHAATTSGETLDLLVKFFRGPFVLTWIHALALFGRLGTLVKAARVLLSFITLNRKVNADQNPLLHRLQDLELLDLWATDLVKIVGKFGRHLLTDPAAIYKTIPPFCPQESVVYRQFRQSKSSELEISGISNAIWNDCLARITLQNGAKARKLTSAGRHFAVLSSTGNVTLFNSYDFDEVCTLRHAEHIMAMCFSGKCDRFVSYGLKSTRVWAVPSGQLLISIENPVDTKALAITFAANDAKIMTGSEDKSMRCFSLDNIKQGWQILDPSLLRETSLIEGGFITSPRCMAFNADATQIAVAYRGFPLSVWAISEPRLIGRCKRVAEHRPDHARPSVSWMAVDRVTWNPITGHILGLYKDGCIFKWNPVGDENQEARATADEIEASPDGKLFLTSDSNGTVKVWNFAYFSVIYQLSSESLVTGLAFSPDCRRFYDLRGASVNVWEPNSLVRLSETEDAFNETASEDQTSTSFSQTSEAWVAPVEPICALAAASNSSLYCAGNEDGAVVLFDKSKGKLLELVKFLNFLSVAHLAWGDDGDHIAAADLGGNIVVKSLNFQSYSSGKGNLEVESLLTAKVKIDVGAIHQILLNRNSTKLLITCQSRCQIWSLGTGFLHPINALPGGEARKWLNHPLREELILGVGPGDLKVFCWENLAEVACFKFGKDWLCLREGATLDTDDARDLSLAHLTLGPSDGPGTEFSVCKAFVTQDGKHFLTQTSAVSTWGRSIKHLLIFEISSLGLSRDANSSTIINSLQIPSEILTRIEVPLGILSGGRLVFLDHDLWMCTFRLNSVRGSEGLQRHYFIPRDWASTECLEQCCMLDDGTFLCPKDGEVAVIRSGLGVADW